MPRKLKVPREEALSRAMKVFWSKGYNATSVDDLQDAMGIQRGSFYLQFKDKKSLFLECLEFYREQVVEKRRDLVRNSESPIEGVFVYFELLIEHVCGNREVAGCLNTNSVVEMALWDKKVSTILKKSIQSWEEFWLEQLKLAVKKNMLSGEIDLKAMAQLIVGITQGINVIGKVNPDPLFLKNIVKTALAPLKNP